MVGQQRVVAVKIPSIRPIKNNRLDLMVEAIGVCVEFTYDRGENAHRPSRASFSRTQKYLHQYTVEGESTFAIFD